MKWKVIVILSKDWADEFTAEQFKIFDSAEEAQTQVEALCKHGGYFGTNEGWEEGSCVKVTLQ